MIHSLLNFLYPKRCTCCTAILDQYEALICTSCRHRLPLTNFHKFNDASLKKVFYGRLPLKLGTALFYFEKKGPIQELMHNLKYRDQDNISGFLGNWLGTELANEVAYQKIDIIIPVPLHPNKLRKRGYNQVAGFGKQLAEKLQATYDDTVLHKIKDTKTQVFKNRSARNDEIYTAFGISNYEDLIGKHILLVDDIITTGATLESCGLTLLQIPKITLSIAAMAIAV